MDRTFLIVPGSAISHRLALGFGVFLTLMSLSLLPKGPPFAVLVVLSGTGMFGIAWSMRHVQFTLSPDSLRVRGDLFGRTIPRSALRAEEASLVSLDTDAPHQPTVRTCGTGWPGYLAGWFRLRNHEKALAFITNRTQVIYLPTTQGYSLLLSVSQPEEFLRALRS